MNFSILLAVLVAPFSGDEIDNPEFKMWSAYGVGTAVTLKSVTDTSGQKMEMSMTTTLKSKSDKELVLETKMKMVFSGQTIDQPPTTRKVPAKVKKPKPVDTKKVKKPETGKETIEAAGQKFACTWTKTTIEAAGSKTESKVWMCDEVPGRVVKMEAVTSGEFATKMTQTLTKMTVKK